MREYEALWRAAVAPARPDLPPAELALVVGAALAMLNASSLIESPVPQPARAELLRAMTMQALGCSRSTSA